MKWYNKLGLLLGFLILIVLVGLLVQRVTSKTQAQTSSIEVTYLKEAGTVCFSTKNAIACMPWWTIAGAPYEGAKSKVEFFAKGEFN